MTTSFSSVVIIYVFGDDSRWIQRVLSYHHINKKEGKMLYRRFKVFQSPNQCFQSAINSDFFDDFSATTSKYLAEILS